MGSGEYAPLHHNANAEPNLSTDLQHIQSQLIRRRVAALEGQQQASDGLGVTQHMVLQELVKLVEAVVMNQGVDDQLVQEMLTKKRERKNITKYKKKKICKGDLEVIVSSSSSYKVQSTFWCISYCLAGQCSVRIA